MRIRTIPDRRHNAAGYCTASRAFVALVALLMIATCPPAGAAAATAAVAAWPPTSALRDGASVSAYGWPLDPPPVVVRPFVPPPQPWLAGHRGVDLAASPGARVLAAGAGVVAFAGRVAGTGVVSVDHAGGLRTTYQPVTASVSAGQVLAAGEPIGVLVDGHPGCPVAACLHWGLRIATATPDVYLDPLSLLGAAHIRLLPLAGAIVPEEPG